LLSKSDLFKTNLSDTNINDASSYLDLGPLYGSNQDEQDSVRTFVDGKLKPDCFSELRILGFPPGVSALLVCFNRFHNYVAGELAAINVGGRFSMPVLANIQAIVQATMPKLTTDQIVSETKTRYSTAVLKRDNDLFQTARLYVHPK
jgi:Animal haem peroxidase